MSTIQTNLLPIVHNLFYIAHMAHKIIYRIPELIAQLEAFKSSPGYRMRYSDVAVADRVGISRSQLIKIMKNDTRRVDFDTLEGFLNFFADEGMPISIDQLFTISTIELSARLSGATFTSDTTRLEP